MGLYPEPEKFAEALGIGIWKESGAECGGVNVLGDVIVRPSADMRRGRAVAHHQAGDILYQRERDRRGLERRAGGRRLPHPLGPVGVLLPREALGFGPPG